MVKYVPEVLHEYLVYPRRDRVASIESFAEECVLVVGEPRNRANGQHTQYDGARHYQPQQEPHQEYDEEAEQS